MRVCTESYAQYSAVSAALACESSANESVDIPPKTGEIVYGIGDGSCGVLAMVTGETCSGANGCTLWCKENE